MSNQTKNVKGFTKEEREAMKERFKELHNNDNGESAVQAKIAEMSEPDRGMAKQLHALVMSTAPMLVPRTWYGMPAYSKDGNVLCFFQSAEKFKSRYATFGFSDRAKLDDGEMWPVYFALKELTPSVEVKIVALVKKAVS